MAIQGPPPPILPPWAKALWWIRESLALGQAHQAFDFGDEIAPNPTLESDPLATLWMKFVITYEDTLSQEAADNQQFSFEVANFTNGSIDNTWTQADFDQVATQVEQTVVVPQAAAVCARYTASSIKAYRRTFNPYGPVSIPPSQWTDPPFGDSGPPQFTRTISIASTGAGTTAPQPCNTVTEVTASRRNWGRMYMPTFGGNSYGPDGRLTAAHVDAQVARWIDCYEGLYSQQFIPLVPTTSVSKNPTRTLQSVHAISCDNVPDVIRRRRPKFQTYKVTLPLPA